MMINFAIILYFLAISCVQPQLLVKVPQGILNGTIKETRHGRKYSSFLAIPYAEPPTENLRFRNPVAGKAWDGIRAADEDANECPQSNDGKLTGDEDCLYLNVYSPRLEYSLSSANKATNVSLLPVMAWIHGGAFVGGNSSYAKAGAGYLLDKDIVLVTMNYRLGIFGFFSTGDSAAPGNFGLKDQVLALKWIQENIKIFGGDPNKVTIFGESAGGVSVSLHAISDSSTGLFHQYIIQSGSPLCPWAYQKRNRFRSFTKALAALVFCPFFDSEGLVSCLQKKSMKQLMDTSSIFSTIARFAKLTWTPTDESEADGAFLTDSPENLIDQNKIKDLPFITGQVSDEGLVITERLHSSSALYSFVRMNHIPIIAYVANSYLDPDYEISFTSVVNNFYFNNLLFTSPKSSYLENLEKFISDGFFFYPEVKMLDKVASKITNPIYFYSFAYRGTFSGTSKALGDNRNIGVSHGDELIYLFPMSPKIFKTPELKMTATDKSVIDLMVDLWTSFAINGKPTSKNLPDPNLWRPYTKEKKIHLQIGNINNNSDPTVTLSNIYYPERIDFWKKRVHV